MKWVFEHLNVILLIAGAIAYWLNQRAKEKAGEDADYDGDGTPDNRLPRRPLATEQDGDGMDQEERARRIREEIMRKIAERRGQPAPPPIQAPRLDPFRPVFQENAAPVPPPLRPVEPASPRPVVVTVADDGVLARQRRLAEEMERLEGQRREARARAEQARRQASAPASGGVSTAPTGALASRGVGAELRDPKALRRAFVLREVISPPVALR